MSLKGGDVRVAQGKSVECQNTSHETESRRAVNAATVLALVLLVCSFLRTWEYGYVSAAGVDFYQFWAVARTVAESPVIRVYSAEGREQIGRSFGQRAQSQIESARARAAAAYRKVLETYSSPFLYTFFRLFSSESYEFSFRIYLFVCLACSAFGVLALCRSFGYSILASLLALAWFTEWFEPLLSDIRVGNVNQIQLALLGLYLLLRSRSSLRRREIISGFVLGLSILFKPNLISVAFMLSLAWIIDRRFRALRDQYLGISLAAVAAFSVSSVFFRSAAVWVEWLRSLRNLPDSITTIGMGNCSLSRLLADLVGMEIGRWLAVTLTALVMISIWSARRASGPPKLTETSGDYEAFQKDALMVCVGCLVYLISARLVWLHYVVLAVPAILFLLSPLRRGAVGIRSDLKTLLVTALAILLVGINPFTLILTGPFVSVVVVCIGLVLLFGMCIREIRLSRRAGSEAAPNA